MKLSPKSVLAALAVGLAFVPMISNAEEATPPAGSRPSGGGGGGGGGGRNRMTPEAQVAALDAAVTLTAEQKTKVTAIYTKAAADMQALSQEERQTKGREIRAAIGKEVRALLTPEQQAKFDAMPQGGRGGGRPAGDKPKE